jgi:hypothetical protein
MSETVSQQNTANILCARCGLELKPGKVTLTYMGSNFPVELLKCEQCGLVFISEDLALGKMLQVERALEDK